MDYRGRMMDLLLESFLHHRYLFPTEETRVPHWFASTAPMGGRMEKRNTTRFDFTTIVEVNVASADEGNGLG